MEVGLGTGDDRFPNHKTEWCYDYTNETVRNEKLSLIREILEDYEADGLELDFMFFPLYFRQEETGSNIATMNQFVAQVRALTQEIGARQSRQIPIMARVWQRRDDNLGIGIDVEAWIAAGHPDVVVRWKDGGLAKWIGKPVTLRIRLQNADLYSFWMA